VGVENHGHRNWQRHTGAEHPTAQTREKKSGSQNDDSNADTQELVKVSSDRSNSQARETRDQATHEGLGHIHQRPIDYPSSVKSFPDEEKDAY
jgi:hypothetical protein